jgi:hypothetical protein
MSTGQSLSLFFSLQQIIYSNKQKSAEKKAIIPLPPNDWIQLLLKAKSQLVIHKIKYHLPFDTYIANVLIIAFYYYILVSMDTASNCGMTTYIYDEVFTIRSHARTPIYRCVVTMNTGYSGTHSIEIISENVRITDCGVRLGIYDGANTDVHQLVRL